MLSEKGAIIVITGRCPHCDTHHARVHHRSFPELAGIGDTPREAAMNLIRRLTAESGFNPDAWHKGAVDQAISELQKFTEPGGEISG